MKFENKYIKIKNNDKEITLHNYIYDRYLELFSQSQYESDENRLVSMNNKKNLYYCYIKFDTTIKDITNANKSDFNISLERAVVNASGNCNSVSTTYTYFNEKVYDLKEQQYKDLNDYVNKKVTALAFGNDEIMSCVDTSNYNIKITDETFAIVRKDIMSTDGECIGIEYPLHLASTSNIYQRLESEAINVPVWAKLYSVGFGRIKGSMDDEYIIGKEIKVIKESDTVFGFNLLKGFQQNVYPQNAIYTSGRLYPLPEYVQKETYPFLKSYCGNNKYPLKSDYKYIVYKFKLYYYDTMQGRIIELDRYYTLNYAKTNLKGIFEIKTKIERRKQNEKNRLGKWNVSK